MCFTGYFLPFCTVFFHNVQDRDFCAQRLKGTKIYGRELFVSPKNGEESFNQSTKVFVGNMPSELNERQAFDTLEKLLGENILRGVVLGRPSGMF